MFKSPILRSLFAKAARQIAFLTLGLWLAIMSGSASARTTLNPNDPLGFFTTLADKMLRNTFSFGVTNIPVYINGQFVYTPAVNRVLQLAANIYDASTNSFYPDVFRPVFEHDASGNVFIVGYTNLSSASGPNTVNGLTDPQLILPLDISTLASAGPAFTPITANGTYVNVYGVPWIIGAKKGFPNFNKFGMQTVVQVARKLQIRRSSVPTVINATTFETNQLLNFNISNYLNAECWNSYTNPYSNPVLISASDVLSMMITNSVGPSESFFFNFLLTSNTYVPQWPGYTNSLPSTQSFINPLSSVAVLLTNSDFYFGTTPPGISGFYSDSPGAEWESNNFNLQFPEFGLLVTNQLRLFMLDESNSVYHVIDYVQFAGPQTALDLSSAIEDGNSTVVGYGSDMWSQAVNKQGAPYGIVSQIVVSGQPITAYGGSSYWPNPTAAEAEIDGFATFMGFVEPYPGISQNNPVYESYVTNYVVQVPYTPVVTLSQYTSWQVNDPLVHYLTNDLNFSGTEMASGVRTGVQMSYGQAGSILSYPSFNTVNDRYQPWGIQYSNGVATSGPNGEVIDPYALDCKDPLVWSANYWSFPMNVVCDLTGLGQVHRGTPWQTVYLKADDALNILDPSGDINSGTNTWVAWTGDNDIQDAATMAPVNDRPLVSLLVSLLNTNDATRLMSVNDTNTADWLNVLNGITVCSNAASLPNFIFPSGIIPQTAFDTYVMPGNSPQAEIIASGIAQAKTTKPNQDFYSIGDILSAPVLVEDSPWLNTTNVNQQRYGITDAAYEAIPAQLLLRLRPDSFGATSLTNGFVNLQFSGSDALSYAVQESSDLVHWTIISTNTPVQGSFNVLIPPTPNSAQQFYRSVLLP